MRYVLWGHAIEGLGSLGTQALSQDSKSVSKATSRSKIDVQGPWPEVGMYVGAVRRVISGKKRNSGIRAHEGDTWPSAWTRDDV